MSFEQQTEGVVRARSRAADTLLTALKMLEGAFTEKQLADSWIDAISRDNDLLPFGWYQPPPNGMSVMIAKEQPFARLNYMSLRDEINWPSEKIRYSQGSILYPYFSAIDRKTLMIGDYVGTFYNGADVTIRDWIRDVYHTTCKIVDNIRFGMSFSEIFSISENQMSTLGARNNTFSLSGGLASDIGHTVPLFGEETESIELYKIRSMSPEDLSKFIADQRQFISGKSSFTINKPCAFTIEPQFLLEGLPMASFHMIVIISNTSKLVVEKFRRGFEYFGMDRWIGAEAK
jgi:hypothetical protein